MRRHASLSKRRPLKQARYEAVRSDFRHRPFNKGENMEGWIRDRFPKAYEQVLLYADGEIRAGYWCGHIFYDGMDWCYDDTYWGHDVAGVVAWMPVPNKPRWRKNLFPDV